MIVNHWKKMFWDVVDSSLLEASTKRFEKHLWGVAQVQRTPPLGQEAGINEALWSFPAL